LKHYTPQAWQLHGKHTPYLSGQQQSVDELFLKLAVYPIKSEVVIN